MNYLPALELLEPEAATPETAEQSAPDWTAIVLAGQRPGVDPLAKAFGQTHKALVEISGQPMLAHVLKTLLASPQIARIIVLAQDPDILLTGKLGWAATHTRILPMVSTGGIAESVASIAGSAQAPWPVFVTTADHPLLTLDMVEPFLSGSSDVDIAVGAVERSVVQARYRACNRTWLKFCDGAYSGANMFALRNGRTSAALSLWSAAEQHRKHALRLFLHFGPMLAMRAITRSIGFGEAIAAAGRNLGVSARLVALDVPEAAIDIDKPGDHRQAEAIMAQRIAASQVSNATGLSIFDLDRTLTRKPTYTAFLVFAALRRSPWRLLLAPCVLACMLAYLVGLISRRRLKELEQSLMLGGTVSRHDIDDLADLFARETLRKNVPRSGLARIAQERAEGRRVILATAASAFYLDAIAARIGIDEVVATGSVWQDDELLAKIDGQNCYGDAKQQMLSRYLESEQLCRDQVHVRFFSDHVSDLPTFDWADEPVAVNPSRKLQVVAKQRGWPILQWR